MRVCAQCTCKKPVWERQFGCTLTLRSVFDWLLRKVSPQFNIFSCAVVTMRASRSTFVRSFHLTSVAVASFLSRSSEIRTAVGLSSILSMKGRGISRQVFFLVEGGGGRFPHGRRGCGDGSKNLCIWIEVMRVLVRLSVSSLAINYGRITLLFALLISNLFRHFLPLSVSDYCWLHLYFK